MATTYQLAIQLTPATVQALIENEFTLYAFQAADATSHGDPAPFVSTQQLFTNIVLSWADAYAAYTSRDNGIIRQMSTYNATLGQMVTVEAVDGTGVVTTAGPADAISINNATTTQFTCGIGLQRGGGIPAVLNALPLFGLNMEAIAPVPQYFFMFSTQPVGPGGTITTSYGPGILVDYTNATERAVTFDINTGWSADGDWATAYPANQDLSEMLVRLSPMLREWKAQVVPDAIATEITPADTTPAESAEPAPA